MSRCLDTVGQPNEEIRTRLTGSYSVIERPLMNARDKYELDPSSFHRMNCYKHVKIEAVWPTYETHKTLDVATHYGESMLIKVYHCHICATIQNGWGIPFKVCIDTLGKNQAYLHLKFQTPKSHIHI